MAERALTEGRASGGAALGFGLKAIGKALARAGLIGTHWPDSGPADGMGAMVAAWSAAEEVKDKCGVLRDAPIMREVEHYNEVDCRVMNEVLAGPCSRA